MKNKKSIVLAVIIAVVLGGFWVAQRNKSKVSGQEIFIGFVTDLTGPAKYWGNSTRMGAELAKAELEQEGYKVNLLFEDYKLDPKEALSSAQKLVLANNADALYGEFNPAAFVIGDFVKGKNTLFMYDAAPVSPLKDNPYVFKTYLDYKEGCKQVAQKFKSQGIEKIGMLEMQIEPGALCTEGVREVFGDVMVEKYNLGDTDFKTQFLKFKSTGVQAVINIAFEGDTLNALKVIKDQKLQMRYGTTDDSITDQVKKLYPEQLKGIIAFGFSDVDPVFVAKLKETAGNQEIASEYAAALGYIHTKQLVRALDSCKKDIACATEKLAASPSDPIIGFNRFNDRQADITMKVKEY